MPKFPARFTSKREAIVRSPILEDIHLGPELQLNANMDDGIIAWVSTGATIIALVDQGENAVILTATVVNGGASMTISDLIVGKVYRIKVRARTGTGVTQRLHNVTWATLTPPVAAINTSYYRDYVFDLLATAVSGFTNIRAALSGSVGDIVYVSEVSIKEIL